MGYLRLDLRGWKEAPSRNAGECVCGALPHRLFKHPPQDGGSVVDSRLARSILSALHVSKPHLADTAFWQSLDVREGKGTLTWLDLSGLALYLREKFRALDSLETLPPALRAHLDRRDAENRVRVAAISEEFQNLNRLLAGAGIEHAVLKGFALLPDYCPDLALRAQYDLDYLIRPASRDFAARVLQKVGYRWKNTRDRQADVYYLPQPSLRIANGSAVFYSACLSRPVELHHGLWDRAEERIRINLPEDLLERALRRRWQGLEFAVLSDEDGLLFQVLHVFRHILRNWCRLSSFLEIALFLERRFSDTAFWKRFNDRISKLRWLPEITGVVFNLASSLFGARIPPQVEAQTAPVLSSLLTRWVENYGKNLALENFQCDKYSLFLHREFLEEPADWARIRRRRLFPFRLPSRLPGATYEDGASSLKKVWRQCLHASRRLKFHAASDLRFVREYPRWLRTRSVLLTGTARRGAAPRSLTALPTTCSTPETGP